MSSTTSSFDGLRVVTFESRQAGPMSELIARQGGMPVAAPALREVPIGDNPAAFTFAALPGLTVNADLKNKLYIAKVGVNYKF